MNVLLLGATGRTGKHVLESLLNSGHTAHVLVRNKDKVKNHSNRLRVFEGDTTDKDTLLKAIQGCDTIISVLNISRTSDFPWAKLRTPKNFLSDTMANILQVATQVAINRIIVCSAWGVSETRKDTPGWFRWFIDHSNLSLGYADHERQEQLLRSSELDYTIIRPVGLTNSRNEKQVRVSQNNIPVPNLTVSRRATARFMVQSLKNSSYSRQAVTISNN